jgi:hypothetical protein
MELDSFTVDYAYEDDVEWLSRNDEHIPRHLLEEKIKRKEYIVAKIGDNQVGYLRFSYFWSAIPYIDVIGVTLLHRRKGIGKALEHWFISWRNTLGVRSRELS